MKTPDPATVTQLLNGVRSGDAEAPGELLRLVYRELLERARGAFAGERNGHTLQPTAIVHEAWIRLAGHLDAVEDRRHFFVIASRAMRQVLVDHARRADAQKRGDRNLRVTLVEAADQAARAAGVDLVDLADSLSRLAELNERHAQVVEMRLFGGLTIDETAQALGVSHTTVETDWFTAKAWLSTRLA